MQPSTFLINKPICPEKNTSERTRLRIELDDARGEIRAVFFKLGNFKMCYKDVFRFKLADWRILGGEAHTS